MEIIESALLTSSQKKAIYDLWNLEYPQNIKFAEMTDLDHYLGSLHNKRYYFLQNHPGTILGWALKFEKESEKWFAIIISGAVQGKGYGRKLLDKLKKDETKLNAWVIDHNNDIKVNGEIYNSPLSFYLNNDFYLRPDIRLESTMISAIKIEWIQDLHVNS